MNEYNMDYEWLYEEEEPLFFSVKETAAPDAPAPEQAREEDPRIAELEAACRRQARLLEAQDRAKAEEEEQAYRLQRKAAKPAAFIRGAGAALVSLPLLGLAVKLLLCLFRGLQRFAGVSDEAFGLGCLLFVLGVVILSASGALSRGYVKLMEK